MTRLVRKCRLISPAARTQAGCSSSRTGHRSPWAAPYNPWCSCTSWPSLGGSSFQARRFSLAQIGSSVPRQGRGRCWRISHSTCEHQTCKPRLESYGGCCSSSVSVSLHIQPFGPYPSFFVLLSLLQLNSTEFVHVTSLMTF